MLVGILAGALLVVMVINAFAGSSSSSRTDGRDFGAAERDNHDC